MQILKNNFGDLIFFGIFAKINQFTYGKK